MNNIREFWWWLWKWIFCAWFHRTYRLQMTGDWWVCDKCHPKDVWLKKLGVSSADMDALEKFLEDWKP